MKTVGEVLRKARRGKKINLDEIASSLKIKKRFLLAIERDDFSIFASKVAARGFIKNYAEHLGLSSKSVLALFKRDFRDDPKIGSTGLILKDSLSSAGFCWSPKLTLALVIGLVFLILSVYLGFQYFSSTKSPSLVIFSPQTDQEVSSLQVKVEGQVKPSDAIVNVNGKPTLTATEGKFETIVNLLPGENEIVIEAVSRLGKKTVVSQKVKYSDREKDSR